jgi:D-threonate/D-erythronate kinase
VIRAVIADDLTGAADASVHFTARREVRIVLPGGSAWAPPGSEVLEVRDTESRELNATKAAAAVGNACADLNEGVFKKVDSTLRGPVTAELEAARKALGRISVVLAPSLPAQGRRVESGRLIVNGGDAGAVAEILGARIDLVTAANLDSGGFGPLVLVDASTDADLDRIAAACAARPELLPAGSAGLAAALARLEGAGGTASAVPRHRLVLAVVGSQNPTSRAQLEVLRAERPAAVEILDSRAIRLSDLPPETAILATGGATALAVCRELRLDELRPRGELLPGVVWSRTGRPGLVLASKAGGFGGPRLLLEAALKLLGVEVRG